MYKNFCLYYGYARNQSLSCLLISHKTGFEDPADGLRNFAAVIKNGLEGSFREVNPIDSKCCLATTGRNSNAAYCDTCGLSIQNPKDGEISDDELSDIILSLICGNMESLHIETFNAHIDEVLSRGGWDMFASPNAKTNAPWVEVTNAEEIPFDRGFYIHIPDSDEYDMKYIEG